MKSNRWRSSLRGDTQMTSFWPRVWFSLHSCLSRGDRTYCCRDTPHPELHPCSAIVLHSLHILLWLFHALKQCEKAVLAAHATRSLCTTATQLCHNAHFWYVNYLAWKFRSSTSSGSDCWQSPLTPPHSDEQTDRQTYAKKFSELDEQTRAQFRIMYRKTWRGQYFVRLVVIEMITYLSLKIIHGWLLYPYLKKKQN